MLNFNLNERKLRNQIRLHAAGVKHDSVGFTKLLVLLSEIRLTKAEKALKETIEILRGTLRASKDSENSTVKAIVNDLRKRITKLAATAQKRRDNRHLGDFIKLQTAYDLGIINGDELNNLQRGNVKSFPVDEQVRTLIIDSVVGGFINVEGNASEGVVIGVEQVVAEEAFQTA